jgi:hypothetical protein
LILMPPLSHDKLLLLTKLTGGMAALVLAALFISTAPVGSSLTAAVTCSGGTSCSSPSSSGNVTLNLEGSGLAVSGGKVSVVSGATDLLLKWPIPPAGVQDGTNFSCFGDGNTCGGLLQVLAGTAPKYSTTFTDGSDTYLVAPFTSDMITKILKWMPSGNSGLGCFGNGTTCGIATFTVPGNGGYPLSPQIITIGGSTYLALANSGTGLSDSLVSYVYKWMTTQYAEGSLPLRASGVTGTTYFDRSWQIDNNSTVTKIGVYATTPGTTTVKIAKRNSTGNYDIVVSQTCNHPGTGWYDCTLTSPYVVPASGTYLAGAYALSTPLYTTNTQVALSSVAGDKTGTGVAIAELTNNTIGVRVTYSTAVSNTPCFGDGVECIDATNAILGERSVQGIGNGFNTLSTNPSWETVTYGGNTYLMLASDHSNSGSSRLYTYQWMPSTYSIESRALAGVIHMGANTWVDRSWQLFNGLTVTKIGIISTTSQTITVKIVKRNSAGNYDIVSNDSCAIPGTGWYDCTLATPYTIPATGQYYIGIYGNNFAQWTGIATTPRANSNAGDITGTGKTITEGTGSVPATRVTYSTAIGGGCFGDGAACNTTQTLGVNTYQSIAIATPGRSNVFTQGGVPYLIVGSYGTAAPAYVFKWTASGADCGANGGWGNGTACANPTTAGQNTYQQIQQFNYVANKAFTIAGNLYLLPGAYSTTTTPLYKWISSGTNCPTGGGFGADNIATPACATSAGGGIFQAIKIDNSARLGSSPLGTSGWGIIPDGTTAYVDDGYSGYVYKWIPNAGAMNMGCFGDGVNCANNTTDGNGVFYTIGGTPSLYASYDVTAFNISGVPFLVVGNRVGPTYAYDVVRASSLPCFGNGATCSTAAQVVHVTQPNTVKTFSMNNVQYMAVGTAASAGSGNSYGGLYLWMNGSNCWGDTTACEAPLQHISVSNTQAISYFTQGGNSYLAFADANGIADEQGPMVHVYQWMPPAGVSNPGGLRVSYYNGVDFGTPVSTGVDTSIDHYWWTSSPAPGVSSDNFSMRWEGGIVAPATGTYSFHLLTDDGTRVWIDGKLIFDMWGLHDDATANSTISSSWAANSQHIIRIEYQEHTRNAGMELTWSYPGSGGYIDVPPSAMYQVGPTDPTHSPQNQFGCFGDTYICDEPYQRTPRSNPQDLKTFTMQGTATSYLVTAGGDGTIYEKWTNGAWPCPVNGGFGNGTICSHEGSYNNAGLVGAGNTSSSVEPFTIGGNQYLTSAFSNSSNVVSIYKWIPGSNCFGDGTTCDVFGNWNSYQTSGSNTGDGKDLYVFDNNGTTSLAYTSDDFKYVRILRWNANGTGCPAGGGMGTGTSTCSTATFLNKILQGISSATTGYPQSSRVLPIGSELFLLTGVAADATGSLVYRWMPSSDCFGDGTFCGGAFQKLPIGDTLRVEATTTPEWFILHCPEPWI